MSARCGKTKWVFLVPKEKMKLCPLVNEDKKDKTINLLGH
jgi:hypothetical protein